MKQYYYLVFPSPGARSTLSMMIEGVQGMVNKVKTIFFSQAGITSNVDKCPLLLKFLLALILVLIKLWHRYN